MPTDPSDPSVRELVDLDVQEVSLVDRPAIQRTFLVVKRHEESEPNMTPEEKAAKDKKDADDKKAAEEKAAAEAKAKADGEEEEEEEDKSKAGDDYAAAAAKCGVALKAAMDADAENADAYKWGMDSLAKLADGAADAEKAKGDDDKADGKFKEATKSMTASRVAELKAAHNHFGEMLTLIGALKAEEEEEEDEEMKSDKKKADAIGKAIAEALAPVAKAVKAVNDRLETVEKTRGAAKGEGDDKTDVKKGEKSLFAGLV